ncbi:hypothetical protein [uncultured Endozoicomonas sp.]|uniref:hypothetical protein n=1 Tax=uncultured Endozoicomonas sp. TaxID=432652 RepID=UPI0026167F1B|nr:hypothetical protein [uncultured Endozoicomonas sp.]
MSISGISLSKLPVSLVKKINEFGRLVEWLSRKVGVHKLIKVFLLPKKRMIEPTTQMKATDIRCKSIIEVEPSPGSFCKATWPVKSSQQEVESQPLPPFSYEVQWPVKERQEPVKKSVASRKRSAGSSEDEAASKKMRYTPTVSRKRPATASGDGAASKGRIELLEEEKDGQLKEKLAKLKAGVGEVKSDMANGSKKEALEKPERSLTQLLGSDLSKSLNVEICNKLLSDGMNAEARKLLINKMMAVAEQVSNEDKKALNVESQDDLVVGKLLNEYRLEAEEELDAVQDLPLDLVLSYCDDLMNGDVTDDEMREMFWQKMVSAGSRLTDEDLKKIEAEIAGNDRAIKIFRSCDGDFSGPIGLLEEKNRLLDRAIANC